MKIKYMALIVATFISASPFTADQWKSLFDGKTLAGWEAVRYAGGGEPYARNGVLVLPAAKKGIMTGIRWVGDSIPTVDYVISYEARRVEGNDIFAGLTFPYKDSYASLILGGWRNVVNGISCIDGYDASENETFQRFSLGNNRWYPVTLRVTTDSIRAYIANDEIVSLATAGKDLHLRDEVLDTGLTFWTYVTSGEIRNIRIKRIP